MDIAVIIILISGISGLIIVYLIRKKDNIVHKTEVQKFHFSLLQFLFMGNSSIKHIYKENLVIEQGEKVQIILKEIKKTKDNSLVLSKLYELFCEFDLIDFELQEYRRGSYNKKIEVIRNLSLVKTEDVKRVLLSILERDEDPQIVLETGRALLKFLDGKVFYDVVLNISHLPENFTESVIDIVYGFACRLPAAEIEERAVSKDIIKEVSSRYLDFLFGDSVKKVISGAYTLGFFKVRETSNFLIDRLNSFSDNEASIHILKALKKLRDVESASQIYNFILSKHDTFLIQEALSTLKSFGLEGNKYLIELSKSERLILSVFAKAYIDSSFNAT